MEQEKTKNNTWLIILLILIILGLTGYIVYDKILSNREAKEPETKEVEETESNETITQNETQVLKTRVGDIIVSTDGSVYYVPNTKFLDYHSDGKTLNFIDDKKIGTYSKYKVEGYKLGVINEGLIPTEFEGYKLDLKNVTAAYECYFGQDSWSDSILFTTKSGKVAAFTVYINISNDKTDVKIDNDITNYENIVSILQSQGFESSNVLLVDKEGNKYKFDYTYNQ